MSKGCLIRVFESRDMFRQRQHMGGTHQRAGIGSEKTVAWDDVILGFLLQLFELLGDALVLLRQLHVLVAVRLLLFAKLVLQVGQDVLKSEKTRFL